MISFHSVRDGGCLLSHFLVITFLQLINKICIKYLSPFFNPADKTPKNKNLKEKTISEPNINFISSNTFFQNDESTGQSQKIWICPADLCPHLQQQPSAGLLVWDSLIFGVMKYLMIFFQANSRHRPELVVEEDDLQMFSQSSSVIFKLPSLSRSYINQTAEVSFLSRDFSKLKQGFCRALKSINSH